MLRLCIFSVGRRGAIKIQNPLDGCEARCYGVVPCRIARRRGGLACYHIQHQGLELLTADRLLPSLAFCVEEPDS
jgi:hypothetical protein